MLLWNRLLRDSWLVLFLLLVQTFLAMVWALLFPYAYLIRESHSSEKVANQLRTLESLAEKYHREELTPAQAAEEREPILRALFEKVPWILVVLFGTFLIYPLLGWWCGKLLHYPEMGGLLLFFSIVSEHNLILFPQKIEYLNFAKVGFSLRVLLFFLVLEFVLLTVGILAQKGQAHLNKSEESEF